MAGDPADIGGAKVDVIGMVIEDVFEGGGRIQHVAGGGVEHSFRFSGAAARVKHEERSLRVELSRGEGGEQRLNPSNMDNWIYNNKQ